MKSLILAGCFVAVTVTAADNESALKQEFLQCDVHSSQYVLDDGEAAYCSEVYEKLKNQFFGGDSAALQRWWQGEKSQKKSP